MIKEDRLKESTLDDSASIYQNREMISEKEKWKSLKGKAKWDYFNQYYRNKLIIGIIIIGFVIYMAVTMLTPKTKTELYVAVINNAFSQSNVDIMKDEFADILQVEKDSLALVIDNAFYTSTSGEYSEYTIANETKLGTYIFAGDIDIMIVNQSDFEDYAYRGNYIKLSEVLPSDLITKLADEFVDAEVNLDSNATSDEESSNTEVGTYGISLKNAVAFDSSNQKIDDPILAIVANSSNKDNVIEYIKYLFDID